jgi:hypothetical protein
VFSSPLAVGRIGPANRFPPFAAAALAFQFAAPAGWCRRGAGGARLSMGAAGTQPGRAARRYLRVRGTARAGPRGYGVGRAAGGRLSWHNLAELVPLLAQGGPAVRTGSSPSRIVASYPICRSKSTYCPKKRRPIHLRTKSIKLLAAALLLSQHLRKTHRNLPSICVIQT